MDKTDIIRGLIKKEVTKFLSKKGSPQEDAKGPLKEWNDNSYANAPKRWSIPSNSSLTEFEKLGGKDRVGTPSWKLPYQERTDLTESPGENEDQLYERDDKAYKIALDLVGVNARNKVFKRHRVDKYDADTSTAVVQEAIEILKRLL